MTDSPKRKFGGIAVVRAPDGRIRVQNPDGSTRLVTDAEWEEILRQRSEGAQRPQEAVQNGG